MEYTVHLLEDDPAWLHPDCPAPHSWPLAYDDHPAPAECTVAWVTGQDRECNLRTRVECSGRTYFMDVTWHGSEADGFARVYEVEGGGGCASRYAVEILPQEAGE